jgi:hypothetical protein
MEDTMQITLNELIELLEETRERLGTGDCKIKIAEQPEYPFEYEFAGVVARPDVPLDEEEGETLRDHQNGDDVILLAGRQLGYTTKDLWHYARK